MNLFGKCHQDAESMSLLPDGQRGSTFDETTAAGGRRYGNDHQRYPHHNRDDSVRPKPSFRRLAWQVLGGIAFVFVVSAAAIFYNKHVPTITSGSSGLNVATITPGSSHLNVGAITPNSNRPYSNLGGDDDRSSISTGANKGVKSKAALGEEEVDNPPNVIFILVDDLGMNDVGSTSTDMAAATPFIESLAEDGVRIVNYYTNHMCTPARVSLPPVKSQVRECNAQCTNNPRSSDSKKYTPCVS